MSLISAKTLKLFRYLLSIYYNHYFLHALYLITDLTSIFKVKFFYRKFDGNFHSIYTYNPVINIRILGFEILMDFSEINSS